MEFSEADAKGIINGKDQNGSPQGPSIVRQFRENPPREIAGKQVIAVLDFKAQIARDLDGRKLFTAASHAGLVTYESPDIPKSFKLALRKISDNPAAGGIYSFAHEGIKNAEGQSVTKDEKLPTEDFIMLFLEDGTKVIARPSGTEPKIKFYINGRSPYAKKAELGPWIARAMTALEKIADDAARERFPERFRSETRSELRALVLSRAPNQSIMIGNDIEVTVAAITEDRVVFLGIRAPSTVAIHRKEVYETLKREEVPPQTVKKKFKQGRLALTRKRGGSIMIGDDIEVRVQTIRGQSSVRLRISAPANITIHRKEVYEAIQREEQSAKSPKETGDSAERSELRQENGNRESQKPGSASSEMSLEQAIGKIGKGMTSFVKMPEQSRTGPQFSVSDRVSQLIKHPSKDRIVPDGRVAEPNNEKPTQATTASEFARSELRIPNPEPRIANSESRLSAGRLAEMPVVQMDLDGANLPSLETVLAVAIRAAEKTVSAEAIDQFGLEQIRRALIPAAFADTVPLSDNFVNRIGQLGSDASDRDAVSALIFNGEGTVHLSAADPMFSEEMLFADLAQLLIRYPRPGNPWLTISGEGANNLREIALKAGISETALAAVVKFSDSVFEEAALRDGMNERRRPAILAPSAELSQLSDSFRRLLVFSGDAEGFERLGRKEKAVTGFALILALNHLSAYLKIYEKTKQPRFDSPDLLLRKYFEQISNFRLSKKNGFPSISYAKFWQALQSLPAVRQALESAA